MNERTKPGASSEVSGGLAQSGAPMLRILKLMKLGDQLILKIVGFIV